MFKIEDLWIDLSRAKDTQARGLSMGNPPSGKDLGFSCGIGKNVGGFYHLDVFDSRKTLVLSLCLTKDELINLVIDAENTI
jgi:hypothetical protein